MFLDQSNTMVGIIEAIQLVRKRIIRSLIALYYFVMLKVKTSGLSFIALLHLTGTGEFTQEFEDGAQWVEGPVAELAEM